MACHGNPKDIVQLLQSSFLGLWDDEKDYNKREYVETSVEGERTGGRDLR